MEFRRIIDKEDKYFKNMISIYKESFPIYEQRKVNDYIEALSNEEFYCTAVIKDDTLMGIINYWKWGSYKYIEHFAIEKSLRGRSYGSLILKKFCSGNDKVILEIDPPNDEVSIKRFYFYKNLGFKLNNFNHIHPPYRIGYRGHELKVLSLKYILTKEEYQSFDSYLKEIVMNYCE